jgi:hypothetical protein
MLRSTFKKNFWLSDRLNLSKSDIRYHNFEPEILTGSLAADSLSSSGNNWKVTINRMNMADNVFIYKVGDVTAAKNEFNPAHLEFEHMTFAANDFYYDKNLVSISVKDFSATDQNGFIINNLETNFSMDATSITADKLKLKTLIHPLMPIFTFNIQHSNRLRRSINSAT